MLRRLRGWASVKTQSGLRPLWVFTPAHFAVAGLAAQALIRNRKTSYTAGTLSEIPLEIIVNMC
jgi:hypothetical protein